MKTSKEPKPIGVITHYYGKLGVAIVRFSQSVKTGTTLHFKGATTDFQEAIREMQYDHKDISATKKGQEVGIKVKQKVREGDEVFEVV